MTEWWTGLSLLMKFIWVLTLGVSIIFLIQSVMTFIGADADASGLDGGAFDMDMPDDPSAVLDAGASSLYTFRNFVNFFLGFGWSAIIFRNSISSTGLLMLISVVIGVLLVAAVMYLFKWLASMQQSGTINVYKSAVGCQGTVYLTIPGERSSQGKVQISISNSIREFNALTDGDTLKTGTPIKVTEVINASTLLVEPLQSFIV